MKKFFGLTTISVAGTMLFTGLLLSLAGENFAAQNPVSGIAQEESYGECQYWLRDYNGYLAVFTPGQEEPEMVFQVFTRNLPQYDRQALQDGIGIRNYEELVARIEDFIS
ncbi:MAG: hypothetical protein PHE47_07020 [Oscillospiraceae bacterium]|nr:hypothetical protein [Oscillospiraceae bacterium]